MQSTDLFDYLKLLFDLLSFIKSVLYWLIGIERYDCAIDKKILNTCIDYEKKLIRLEELKADEFRVLSRQRTVHGKPLKKQVIRKKKKQIEMRMIEKLREIEDNRTYEIRQLLAERVKSGLSADWVDIQLRYGKRYPILCEIQC
tara:strand:- start:276 stop:707 length:432 start_codon:yes stop_codon:yes gene_type:complete